jgi:hypothetical protein
MSEKGVIPCVELHLRAAAVAAAAPEATPVRQLQGRHSVRDRQSDWIEFYTLCSHANSFPLLFADPEALTPQETSPQVTATQAALFPL